MVDSQLLSGERALNLESPKMDSVPSSTNNQAYKLKLFAFKFSHLANEGVGSDDFFFFL